MFPKMRQFKLIRIQHIIFNKKSNHNSAIDNITMINLIWRTKIMVHKMKLWNDSFEMIKSGYKTIEMRLNDEKRTLIRIGDTIEFTNTSTNEVLSCVVTNLYKYSSFDELYLHHDKKSIGYLENEIANPKDMLVYYSQENIDKYGVLGIEVKI